jgi:hypothetical protein
MRRGFKLRLHALVTESRNNLMLVDVVIGIL